MKIAVYSTAPYDREFLSAACEGGGCDLTFHKFPLDAHSAAAADGHDAVCIFVNDTADRAAVERLAAGGVRAIALRCAGFNNVDVEAAKEHGIRVVRVPAYSPSAVAEHAVALILALNRKIHRAHMRVREGNFELEGLLGFDLAGSTVGCVGTGHIGAVFCRIMKGFGCEVLAHDPYPDEELEKEEVVRYAGFREMLEASNIVALHCPLTKETHHLIDADALERMREGVMLINTSRGGLVDTKAVIGALKSRKLGSLGIDVYEEEGSLFFRDLSGQILSDDVFARLLTFPNVLITAHQGFFTREAMENIAKTTAQNIRAVKEGRECENEVG